MIKPDQPDNAMTREEYVEEALECGYTPEDIEYFIKIFRSDLEAIGAPPTPYELMPLQYQFY